MLASRAWCVVWGLGLSMAASAQEATVRATVVGPSGSGFGQGIAVLDDLNGDGCNEIAVGAPFDDSGGIDSGLVRILSGADLSIYWERDHTHAGDRLGWAIANAGDVNLDWYPDLLVGAPMRAPGGAAYVYSGEWIVKTAEGQTPQTNLVLLTIFGSIGYNNQYLGSAVLGNLNINNDGHADFLIGAPSWRPAVPYTLGIVRAYSGTNASVLWASEGSVKWGDYGVSLARLRANNNYDSDTLQDYLVGAPGIGAGYVRVLSGATGQTLATLTSQSVNNGFGRAIDVLGDTTGDGKDEFVVAAPLNPPVGGRIYYYPSEPDGCSSFEELPPVTLGLDAAATGDINLDGFEDFVASSTNANPALYSVNDCARLDFLPNAPPANYPSVVAGGGDLDGDGLNDVLAGDPDNDTVVIYDTSGLVVPAFVDKAWFIGTPGAPVTYAIIKYPAWAFAGQTAQIEVQYDHGAGWVLGYGASLIVPPGDPPQREHVAKITHPAPFTLGGTYQYRVRMWIAGTTPGDWSQPTAGHPAADRAEPKNFVDVVDLGLFMGSWGLGEGDPGYDPLSNFNQLGKVDIVDLGIFWTQWKPIINQE
jgi:hypothetical protein